MKMLTDVLVAAQAEVRAQTERAERAEAEARRHEIDAGSWRRCADQLKAEHEALRRERDEARAFGERAAAIANGQLVTCAFCGAEYPRGTPRHGDGALAEHVRVCEQHPMRQIEAERDALQAERTWRPIESAPKDGTWVTLGWFELPGMDCRKIGFWHDREKAWCDTHQVLHNQRSFPTHWLPLPPVQEDGKK